MACLGSAETNALLPPSRLIEAATLASAPAKGQVELAGAGLAESIKLFGRETAHDFSKTDNGFHRVGGVSGFAERR